MYKYQLEHGSLRHRPEFVALHIIFLPFVAEWNTLDGRTWPEHRGRHRGPGAMKAMKAVGVVSEKAELPKPKFHHSGLGHMAL